MKQSFILFICIFALYGCNSRTSQLPDGWYHLDNTLQDSIVRPAILTTNQIAEIAIDSFIYPDWTSYRINARIIEKKKEDFADATEKAIGRKIAFVYKGKVINAPTVNMRIEGGRFSITCPSKEDALEIYNTIIDQISYEPETVETIVRDSTKLYFEDFVRFDSLFNAWTLAWRTDPAMLVSSNTNDARKLEQYPYLLRMGKKTLPIFVPYLAHPDNFFLLTLYDDLQDDDRLKSTDYSKGEQFRAQESVRKYVEDRLKVKKRIFKSDQEKLTVMKEMMEIDGKSNVNQFYTQKQMDSIMLISDYEIMEAIINNKWFDEIEE